MKHKAWIENYDRDFTTLAEEIGDLRYDSLAEFLRLLARKIERDGIKDGSRGRLKLATALNEMQQSLEVGAVAADRAWKICVPYMLPADITTRIQKEFALAANQQKARKLLLNFNRRNYENTTFRLERCVLFGTNGDLGLLRRNLEMARTDYRDIILQAEYENMERVRDLNFPFGSAERYPEEE